MQNHKKLIVIVGPTAVGKTDVAIRMANFFRTEIISADARQIFQEMNLGTAKPSLSELNKVHHHFVNSHSIQQSYDAATFGREALAVINELFKVHDYVVMCGGSGLYVKAVCDGFDDIPEVPGEIRDELVREFELTGIASLQQKLQALDPDYYQSIDSKNPQRLIRALEVVIGTGMSLSSFHHNNKLMHNFKIIKFGLELPRDVLYTRIDERMDLMIEHGLFREAENLYPQRALNALQTVGYQEIFGYLEGLYDRDETIRLLKRNSRRYSKRQLTWFKRDKDIMWLDPANIEKIMTIVSQS
ncbi:MAG: tRNA (adenosine(37)-N6)-dimethylallyltransferase MiaA [Chryseolinea sp.]